MQSNHNRGHRQSTAKSVQLANLHVQIASAFRSHNFVITTTTVAIIVMSHDFVHVSSLISYLFFLFVFGWWIKINLARNLIWELKKISKVKLQSCRNGDIFTATLFKCLQKNECHILMRNCWIYCSILAKFS